MKDLQFDCPLTISYDTLLDELYDNLTLGELRQLIIDIDDMVSDDSFTASVIDKLEDVLQDESLIRLGRK